MGASRKAARIDGLCIRGDGCHFHAALGDGGRFRVAEHPADECVARLFDGEDGVFNDDARGGEGLHIAHSAARIDIRRAREGDFGGSDGAGGEGAVAETRGKRADVDGLAGDAHGAVFTRSHGEGCGDVLHRAARDAHRADVDGVPFRGDGVHGEFHSEVGDAAGARADEGVDVAGVAGVGDGHGVAAAVKRARKRLLLGVERSAVRESE